MCVCTYIRKYIHTYIYTYTHTQIKQGLVELVQRMNDDEASFFDLLESRLNMRALGHRSFFCFVCAVCVCVCVSVSVCLFLYVCMYVCMYDHRKQTEHASPGSQVSF
jgi:hypothetical protein